MGVLKQQRIYSLNVHVLLIITFCTFGVSFFASQMYFKFIYTAMLFLLMSAYGYFKKALLFVLGYILFFVWFFINLSFSINFPAPLMFTFILTAIPMIMVGYLLTEIPLGKITTGLRQLKLPEKIILVTIVTIRFIPTTLMQIVEVKNSMKVRGFISSPIKILRNPIKTFEYAVVPMIFYSLKISDELSASCVARGIESPYKKTGYYENKYRFTDIFIMVVFVVATIYFLL